MLIDRNGVFLPRKDWGVIFETIFVFEKQERERQKRKEVRDKKIRKSRLREMNRSIADEEDDDE